MYIVFDIGGTKTRIATSKDLMTLSEPVIYPTPKLYEEALALFVEQSRKLATDGPIKSIAGGTKGPLSLDKSTFVNPPDLPDWKGRRFKEDLEEKLGVPVHLENDAALSGLGETAFGAALKYPTASIVVYLTVSTGVGGVRITNKQIDPSGLGFEPGHQIIMPDGEKCGCGGFGHLESYVSGTAIEKKYGRKAESITNPQTWEEIASFLAIGLNNTIVHWSPDLIIVGGGVSNSLPLDVVNLYLKKYLTIFPTPPKIEKAELGDLGGLYGSLVLLHKK